MSRLAEVFSSLRQSGRKALIPFVTAGDPGSSATVPLMHAMVEAGADVIELGVPFSDPMADGPVIQRASERALANGIALTDVLDMVRVFRREDNRTPVVLMGYLNPVEVMGAERFAIAAHDAGVDGVLTVDLPPEEAEPFLAAFRAQALDPIFLLSPTTTAERMETIAAAASGFVYYVSLKGVTGAASLDVEGVAKKMAEIREHTELPVGVGFGIRDAQTAAAVAGVADAVVVGSALVSQIEALANRPSEIAPKIATMLAEMRTAIDELD